MSELNFITYSGKCHCGAIQFIVRAPKQLSIIECNCSICHASGYLHLHVKNQDLTLLKGEDHLNEYRFNTKQARHTFCKICGIKPFYKPRSHPEDYSINVRCLEIPSNTQMNVTLFDGKNWEKNIENFPDQPVGKPTTR